MLTVGTDNEKQIEQLKSEVNRLQEEHERMKRVHDERAAKMEKEKLKVGVQGSHLYFTCISNLISF